MIRLLAAFLLLSCAAFSATTTISDTVSNADASPASGKLIIMPTSKFTNSAGTFFSQTPVVVTLVNGAFTVALEANEGTTPATSYTVTYILTTTPRTAPRVDKWFVPNSNSPLSIADVESAYVEHSATDAELSAVLGKLADATNIGNKDVDNTHLSYLRNVTSDIQAQLDAKGTGSTTPGGASNSIQYNSGSALGGVINSTGTKKFLSQTAGLAPTLDVIGSNDVPAIDLSATGNGGVKNSLPYSLLSGIPASLTNAVTAWTNANSANGAVQLDANGFVPAAELNFNPAVTGSVDRSLQASLADLALSVKSTGAVGNDSHDDTAAIQAALNAVCATGGRLFIPAGIYKITSTITTPKQCNGITFEGAGGYVEPSVASKGAVLHWAGAANGTVLDVYASSWGRYRNFAIDGAGTAGQGIWVQASNYSPADGSSQKNEFSGILIDNVLGTPGRAMALYGQNNDDDSQNNIHDNWFVNNNVSIYQDGNQTVGNIYRHNSSYKAQTYGFQFVNGDVVAEDNLFIVDPTAATGTLTELAHIFVSADVLKVVLLNNEYEDLAGLDPATFNNYKFASGTAPNRVFTTKIQGDRIVWGMVGGKALDYEQAGALTLDSVTDDDFSGASQPTMWYINNSVVGTTQVNVLGGYMQTPSNMIALGQNVALRADNPATQVFDNVIDGRDASYTSGSATLTVASSHSFTAAMVEESCYVQGFGSSQWTVQTIAAYVSATQVTLSENAAATGTAKYYRCGRNVNLGAGMLITSTPYTVDASTVVSDGGNPRFWLRRLGSDFTAKNYAFAADSSKAKIAVYSGNNPVSSTPSDFMEFNTNGTSALNVTVPVALNVGSSSQFRVDASGNVVSPQVTAALIGNASTATALAALPTPCSADQVTTGVDASGNSICRAAGTSVNLNIWGNQPTAAVPAIFSTTSDMLNGGTGLMVQNRVSPQSTPSNFNDGRGVIIGDIGVNSLLTAGTEKIEMGMIRDGWSLLLNRNLKYDAGCAGGPCWSPIISDTDYGYAGDLLELGAEGISMHVMPSGQSSNWQGISSMIQSWRPADVRGPDSSGNDTSIGQTGQRVQFHAPIYITYTGNNREYYHSGATSPVLHILEDGTGLNVPIMLDNMDSVHRSGNMIQFRKSGGSPANNNQTIVATNDNPMQLYSYGYDGATWQLGAAIASFVSGTPAAGSVCQDLRLGTGANTGAFGWKAILTCAGSFGVGTTAPSSMFSVGASNQFQVNSSGNIVKLNGATTSFPSANASGVLTNDGSGNLSWGAASSSSIPHYALVLGASGWQVNGGTAVAAAAATTQKITLFTAPAKYVITGVTIQPNAACSGTSITAVTASVGDTATPDLFASAYSLFDAPSSSNFQDSAVFKRGSTGSEAIVAQITTTGGNVNALSAGCAVDIWVKQDSLQ